jgi:hypothetical protein
VQLPVVSVALALIARQTTTGFVSILFDCWFVLMRKVGCNSDWLGLWRLLLFLLSCDLFFVDVFWNEGATYFACHCFRRHV